MVVRTLRYCIIRLSCIYFICKTRQEKMQGSGWLLAANYFRKKSYTVDVWLSSKYASVISHKNP